MICIFFVTLFGMNFSGFFTLFPTNNSSILHFFKGKMISVTLFGAYTSNMVSIKFSFAFSIIFSITGCWNLSTAEKARRTSFIPELTSIQGDAFYS